MRQGQPKWRWVMYSCCIAMVLVVVIVPAGAAQMCSQSAYRLQEPNFTAMSLHPRNDETSVETSARMQRTWGSERPLDVKGKRPVLRMGGQNSLHG